MDFTTFAAMTSFPLIISAFINPQKMWEYFNTHWLVPVCYTAVLMFYTLLWGAFGQSEIYVFVWMILCVVWTASTMVHFIRADVPTVIE